MSKILESKWCEIDSVMHIQLKPYFNFERSENFLCELHKSFRSYSRKFFCIFRFYYRKNARSSCSRFGSEENSSSITNDLDSIGSGDGPLRNTLVVNLSLTKDSDLTMFYVQHTYV